MICGECDAVMVLTLQAVHIAGAEIYCRDGMEVRRAQQGGGGAKEAGGASGWWGLSGGLRLDEAERQIPPRHCCRHR